MREKLLADVPLEPIGGENGFGPWGGLGGVEDVGEAAGEFAWIISRIIGVMTVVAGIWFFFMMIIGAYGYLSAGGDPKKIETATKRITSALIGLVVIVLAYALVSLIGKLLGFAILNPQDIITKLHP